MRFHEEERRKLSRARLGGPCPDPKGWKCHGTVRTVEEVCGTDKVKHPALMMCDKCKARFNRDGRWADYRRQGVPEPEYLEPEQEQPHHPADDYIPW